MVKLEDIFEDVVAPAGDAAGNSSDGEVAAQPTTNNDDDIVSNDKTGLSTDILGKDCDHKKNGFLGPGCFHMPLFATSKGKKANNKKKKKNKNPYEHGMVILHDSDDFLKDAEKAFNNTSIEDIQQMIKDVAQEDVPENDIICIAYIAIDKDIDKLGNKFILKFKVGDDINFIILEVKSNKFVVADRRLYNADELRRAYSQLKKPGTKMDKLDIKDIQVYIVWKGQKNG